MIKVSFEIDVSTAVVNYAVFVYELTKFLKGTGKRVEKIEISSSRAEIKLDDALSASREILEDMYPNYLKGTGGKL